MKINVYVPITNSGILEKTEEQIDIRKNRWIDSGGISHPLKYLKPIAFSNSNVYFLHLFGDDTKKPHSGKHISLTFFENHFFNLMQGTHWIQKEENIRYLINLTYLTIGIIFAYKKL